MTFNKDKIKYLVLALLIVTFVISYFIWTKNQRILRTNHLSTNAIIKDWNLDAKSGIWLNYEFKVDNKSYRGANKYFELSQNHADNFIGKSFPLLYCPSDPENNELLIKPKDFENFNMTQPDSLQKFNSLFTDN
jgi:hypothetical protein